MPLHENNLDHIDEAVRNNTGSNRTRFLRPGAMSHTMTPLSERRIICLKLDGESYTDVIGSTTGLLATIIIRATTSFPGAVEFVL